MTRTQPPALAGHVLFLVGDVEGVSQDGAVRRLSKGDVVREGDTLRTGAASHLQLKMVDEALLAVRPDSRLHLHSYQFREQGVEGGRAALELVIGGFRSITGAIGHSEKQNYIVRGGKALIGVRGTDHETFVAHSGTYNRVTVGGTYLENPRGRIDLDPSETGFAVLMADEAPMRLARAPEFMHAVFLPGRAPLGPELRADGFGDERRLRGGPSPEQHKDKARAHTLSDHRVSDQGAGPMLPAQTVGENASPHGFGKGGRCGGPCARAK